MNQLYKIFFEGKDKSDFPFLMLKNITVLLHSMVKLGIMDLKGGNICAARGLN